MAFRLKGFLTKKQRDVAAEFINNYHTLMASKDAGEATKAMVEATFWPWVLVMSWALYVDSTKMFEKIICKEAK